MTLGGVHGDDVEFDWARTGREMLATQPSLTSQSHRLDVQLTVITIITRILASKRLRVGVQHVIFRERPTDDGSSSVLTVVKDDLPGEIDEYVGVVWVGLAKAI